MTEKARGKEVTCFRKNPPTGQSSTIDRTHRGCPPVSGCWAELLLWRGYFRKSKEQLGGDEVTLEGGGKGLCPVQAYRVPSQLRECH